MENNPSTPVVSQVPIENTTPSEVNSPKRPTYIKYALFVIIALVLIFGFGTYIVMKNSKTSPIRTSTETPINQPTKIIKQENKPLDELKNDIANFSKEQKFLKPTQYLFYNENSDVVLGDIATNTETIIIKSNGNFGVPQNISTSPNGQYITYLMLAPNLIAELNTNPPYEFHGSDQYELWIVDIKQPTNPEKSKIQSNVQNSIGSELIFEWEKDTSGFSFWDKWRDNAQNKDVLFYSITTKQIKNLGDLQIANSTSISPNEKYYIIPKEKSSATSEPFIYNRIYNLQLYSEDNSSEKTILTSSYTTQNVMLGGKPFSIDENFWDEKFLTNNVILLNHQKLENNKRLILLEAVMTNGTNLLLEKNTFLFANNFGFTNYSVSPDGEKIVTVANEIIENGNESDDQNAIFVYDTKDSSKQYLGKTGYCIRNYYWMSQEEILVHLDKSCRVNDTLSGESDHYLLNVTTGKVEPYTTFKDKNLITVF